MDLLDDLEARGLLHDSTDRAALAARLAEGPITLYYGCDPTADSLHIGNLIGLLVLRRFADAGHRPIALAGGATGMVGDPSGRSEERNLLDEATLRGNVEAITGQIVRVLGREIQVVDNYEWTKDLSVLDFLRDVGKHATVNQMVARESVKARMQGEHGISFTEFSYMLLQANDYRWLHEHEGCELQIGGSDQWGNILSGVDLIRRATGEAAHALCWPLLTAPDGTKLGKTTGARIWLDPERTSPYVLHQHWMSTDDRQVGEFLAKFTLLPLEEIAAVVAEHEAAPHRRIGQRRLAVEATTLVHGPEAAAAAVAAAAVLFGGSLAEVPAATFEVVAGEVPNAAIDRSRLEADGDVATLLAEVGATASRSEAQRLLKQGGIRVNGTQVGPGATVGVDDLRHGRYLLLRRGKADYWLVTVSS
jgi:tyrosyl-tRNA synthetase